MKREILKKNESDGEEMAGVNPNSSIECYMIKLVRFNLHNPRYVSPILIYLLINTFINICRFCTPPIVI